TRWDEADREARPGRLRRLRERMASEGVDCYFGVRPEHTRYLTGIRLGDGEDKVAGVSGQFLVGPDEVVVLADSRYAIQAAREAPDARIENVYGNLNVRWPELVGSLGARRVAVEAGFVSQATWTRLTAAAPDVDLVPVEGWLEAHRAIKEPTEIERIAASCAVADRALAALLPSIRPGRTELERAPDAPLPSPTVFSVEPGVYLAGETGVRIEDLVSYDTGSGRIQRLTQFPREIVVVGLS